MKAIADAFGDVLTEVYGYRQARRVIWAKSVYEAIVTPLTYGVVNFLKRQEGLDVYDYETRFNPLLVRE
jgi:uncharacterized PurR-regulated membrane protein YhhQ (DUF165 family)